ncbi:MAG: PAS domain-containing protein, partial [Nitrospirota bacterium]
ESTLHREVNIKDRVFDETIHLSPQFNVVRIYAFEITERKKAEEAIIRAKEEWERTFDSVPDLIAILDNQHRVMRVNQSMARRLGLKPEECIGLPCYKAVHGTSAPPAFCPHSRTIADGREHIEEVHEDSLGGDFLVSTTPLHDEQGRMVGSVHVAHDITLRKRAEEALKKSHDELEVRVQERTAELVELNKELAAEIAERQRAEETAKMERRRLYDVLETLPVYVVLLTPDYHVPFANRFFRERFGESHGRRCFEYLFHRDEPCEICETYTVLKTMKPHHWEWTGPDSRNYDIYDFPFTDADGTVLILEMGIDITEKKQAEKALKEINETLERRIAERTEELYKEKTISDSTIESLPGIFYLFDSQGRFLKWNRNFELVSGYSAEELSGMHPLDFFAGEDKLLIEQRIREVFTVGQSSAEAEFVSKEGHKTPYFFTGVMTEIDNTNCLIGMGIDITERKKAEAEIERYLEELRISNDELARFNRAAVGRELRMLELKKEVNELCENAGVPPRHRVDFEEEDAGQTPISGGD